MGAARCLRGGGGHVRGDDQLQPREVSPSKATVTAQQRIGPHLRVRRNEEIGNQSRSPTALSPVRPPATAGSRGCDTIEANEYDPRIDQRVHLARARENTADFRPYHRAYHQAYDPYHRASFHPSAFSLALRPLGVRI